MDVFGAGFVVKGSFVMADGQTDKDVFEVGVVVCPPGTLAIMAISEMIIHGAFSDSLL